MSEEDQSAPFGFEEYGRYIIEVTPEEAGTSVDRSESSPVAEILRALKLDEETSPFLAGGEPPFVDITERLNEFLPLVQSGDFGGVLLVVLHQTSTAQVAKLMLNMDQAILLREGELRKQGAFEGSPQTVIDTLALSRFVSSQASTVILLDDTYPLQQFRTLMQKDAEELRFKLTTLEEARCPEYWEALTFRRRSGYREVRSELESSVESGRCGDYLHAGFSPDAEVRYWEEREFVFPNSRNHYRALLRLVEKAQRSLEPVPNSEGDPPKVLRYPENLPELTIRRVIFSAIRLARTYSIRSCEGAPFSCNVFLSLKDFQDAGAFTSLFGFRQPIHFNDDFESEVGGILEIIQNKNLFLMGCLRTGRLQGIFHHKYDSNTPADLKLHRQVVLSEFIRSFPGVLFHIGPHGRLEIYGPGDQGTPTIQLYSDGLTWVEAPILRLVEMLKLQWPGEDQDTKQKRQTFASSILDLLDYNRSSIILLLAEEDDLNLANNLSEDLELYFNLRPVLGSGQTFDIGSVSPQALAAILQCDGFHFIKGAGSVRGIAHQMLRYERSLDDSPWSGAGTNAAAALSKQFSERSLVIKVSASGSIKYFRSGREID